MEDIGGTPQSQDNSTIATIATATSANNDPEVVQIVDEVPAASIPAKCKRAKHNFPWCHTREYDAKLDLVINKPKKQCLVCKKWLKTNCSGWKTHLLTQHKIIDPDQKPEGDGISTATTILTQQTLTAP